MVLANEAAHATLAAEDGVRLGPWGPVPMSLKDASRFHVGLEHQIAQNAAAHGVKGHSTVFLIQRRKGLRPFVATLIPMSMPATRAGEAAVMLYLFDPSNEDFDHLDAISELYGLSKVEARLSRHIALGKSIEDAAVAMRIKAPTARTYLKHVFAKTGTRRQIDLARLLMLSTGRITSSDAPEVLR
jgi:DNA-binding CsgD family transcriptional regulator